jgi:ribose 5-phosphate isomerase B
LFPKPSEIAGLALDSDLLRTLVAEVTQEVLRRQRAGRKVAVGADHGGFELKERLRAYLAAQGFEVVDCGTHSKEACDYPDLARKVGRAVQDGSCEAGVMIDGAGIGSSMACNKLRGIRAALCYDMKTILNSRQHNNANVLTLGAGTNPPEVVEQMVKTWLETPFEGGRHQKRVDKIESEA